MEAFAYALAFVGLPITFGFTLPKLFILSLCVWWMEYKHGFRINSVEEALAI